jgi:hypothetical protein
MADKAYGPGLMRKADKTDGPNRTGADWAEGANSVRLIGLMGLIALG